MSKTDLAKKCNFRIVLKDQENIEFFVQEANIPGITIGTLEYNNQSMHDPRPGDSITYNDLRLLILLDEDFKTYEEIYKYLTKTHDPVSNNLDPDAVVFDAELMISSNKNNFNKKISFKNAWISSIDDIDFITTSTEDEEITFGLEIKFSYFTYETK